jgi:hypothetical protein
VAQAAAKANQNPVFGAFLKNISFENSDLISVRFLAQLLLHQWSSNRERNGEPME